MDKTYRQLSRKLQVMRGPGKPDLVSERPTERDEKGVLRFTDSEEHPTLVSFDADCIVNLEHLLKAGAIVEWEPRPSKAPTLSGKAEEGAEPPGGGG